MKNLLEEVITYLIINKYPQNPSSEIEKTICDADMFHLTKPITLNMRKL